MIIDSDIDVILDRQAQAIASYGLSGSKISALPLLQYKRPTPTLSRVAQMQDPMRPDHC